MPEPRTYIANVLSNLMLSLGIAGVLLRNGLLYTVGAITPGYAAATDFIGELSAEGAPYQILMNSGSLIAFGASIILASKALQLQLPGPESALSCAYLAISGVCFIGFGLFPCTPGCILETDYNQMMIHTLCSFTGALALSLAAMVYGLGLFKGRNPLLHGSAFFLGMLGTTAFVVLWTVIVLAEYNISSSLYQWKGSLQRINMATGDLWVLIACVFTLITRPPARAPEVFRAEQ